MRLAESSIEVPAYCLLIKYGWETGIRTPIGRSRDCSPTIRRSPSVVINLRVENVICQTSDNCSNLYLRAVPLSTAVGLCPTESPYYSKTRLCLRNLTFPPTDLIDFKRLVRRRTPMKDPRARPFPFIRLPDKSRPDRIQMCVLYPLPKHLFIP